MRPWIVKHLPSSTHSVYVSLHREKDDSIYVVLPRPDP